jgi:signal transduction histidine kinase/CheY-like chemotaxis protein
VPRREGDDADSELRLVKALAEVPALVAVLRGPQLIYEFVNAAFIEAMKYDPTGQPFGVMKHEQSGPLRAILERAFRSGEPWTGREVRVDDRFYDVNFRPVRGGNGDVEAVMIHSFEVTNFVHAREAREKMQAQLMQVQKLESLGVMAGGIAHDFNNLLTGILGNASIALLKIPRDSPARASLDDIVAIGRRAADLTRQLLAYSGKGRFQVQPVDLSTHVREIAQLIEASLSKKVQLRIDVGENLPAIEADVAQLQQVVMNLVLNAGEALGDERGVVLVKTGVIDVDAHYALEVVAGDGFAPGRYVFVEVHDTGCGMDDETKAKIFDPFFTTKFSGRGLGLAAVLGIVRGHRGAVRIYSRARGSDEAARTGTSGTTFTVLFPASDRPAASSRRGVAPSTRGEGGLVLVVDDERELRDTAARILEHFGFRAIVARDGRDAVEKFRSKAAEVRAVLLDMTMPEMNGEETFRALREVRHDVRVVLTSGYDEVEATRRFTEKGVAAFLQKPYSAEELIETLGRAMARKP